jgi:hypothetical protein
LYSGQQKNAFRDWYKFTTESVDEHEEKIDKLLESGLLLPTAWEVNQYYRGSMFTFVDCLLTEGYRNKWDK